MDTTTGNTLGDQLDDLAGLFSEALQAANQAGGARSRYLHAGPDASAEAVARLRTADREARETSRRASMLAWERFYDLAGRVELKTDVPLDLS